MRPIVLIVTAAMVLTSSIASADVPWRSKTSRLNTLSASGQVHLGGVSGRTAMLRVEYVLPTRWHRRSTLKARYLHYDTRNSCAHRVVLKPRIVAVDPQSAELRAERFVPQTGPYLYHSGTVDGAVYRIGRVKGSSTVRAVLVQPIRPAYTNAAVPGKVVFAQIDATATAVSDRACHSGGPRGVGRALAASFAAGHVGGFVERR